MMTIAGDLRAGARYASLDPGFELFRGGGHAVPRVARSQRYTE
jgi:hypothetical protein